MKMLQTLKDLRERNAMLSAILRSGNTADLAAFLSCSEDEIHYHYIKDRFGWNFEEFDQLQQIGLFPEQGSTVLYGGIGVDIALIEAVRQADGKVVGVNVSPDELGAMILAGDFFHDLGFSTFSLEHDYQREIVIPRKDIVQAFTGTTLERRVQEGLERKGAHPELAPVHQFGYFDHIAGNILDREMIQRYIDQCNGGKLFDIAVVKGIDYIVWSPHASSSITGSREEQTAIHLAQMYKSVLKKGGIVYVSAHSSEILPFLIRAGFSMVGKAERIDDIKTPIMQVQFHQKARQFQLNSVPITLGGNHPYAINYGFPSNYFVLQKTGDTSITGQSKKKISEIGQNVVQLTRAFDQMTGNIGIYVTRDGQGNMQMNGQQKKIT